MSDFSSLGEVTIVLAIPSPMVFPVSWQEHDGHEQLWVLCPKAWALQIRWDLCMWAGFMEKLEHAESDAAGGEMTKVISKMMQLGKKLMEGASQSQGSLEVMQVEKEFMEMFLVGLGEFIFEKGGHVPQYNGSWCPQQRCLPSHIIPGFSQMLPS